MSSFLEWFNSLAPVWQVGLYALLTALATGLGALPFFFIKNFKKRWTSLGASFAGGLMLTASFQLLQEGTSYSLGRLIAGAALGLTLISLSRWKLGKQSDLEVGDLKGASAFKALLIVGVMTLHSFAEGVGVGVSFGGGEDFGAYISAAIAIHNIPEGLAITMILVSEGVKVWKCMLWSIFSSLPQPILAIPSFLFVDSFKPFLPVGFGLAAGAMLWMVVAEMIPDGFEHAKKQTVAISLVFGVLLMLLLQHTI